MRVIHCSIILLIATLAACHPSADNSPTDRPTPTNPQNTVHVLPTPALNRTDCATNGQSIADIAERTVASVVNISTTRVVKSTDDEEDPFFTDPFFREFFGRQHSERRKPRERREQSLGSGVMVDPAGIILTSSHVVERASDIQITFHDGRNVKASIMGTDPKSDIAVLQLKLDGRELSALHTLPLGDSAKIRLGDLVLAIGNPFGVGQTVTMGIVSAKGRANVGIVDYEDFIQTDAAINPGNSGGALVDMEGKLVGINTAILSRSGGYQGIGFAVPSNMAKPLMDSILKHGRVIRGWLGVAIQDLTHELATALGIDSVHGALVSDIAPKSPAQRAGLRRGDVIQSLNGHAVDSSAHLRNMIAAAGTEGSIEITLLRGQKQLSVHAKLTTQPAEPDPLNETVEESDGILGGLLLRNMDDRARQEFSLPDDLQHGVVVDDVDPEGLAADSGIEPGDVILEINRQPVRSVAQLKEVQKGTTEQILVLIYRAGSTFYLLISP